MKYDRWRIRVVDTAKNTTLEREVRTELVAGAMLTALAVQHPACNLMIAELTGAFVSLADSFVALLVYAKDDKLAKPCHQCRVVLVGMILRGDPLTKSDRAFLKKWYGVL